MNTRPPYMAPPSQMSGMHHAPAIYNPHNLPPNILALFAPRQPMQYIPPTEKPKLESYTGVAQYMDLFETKEEHASVEPYIPMESRRQRAERVEGEKKYKAETKVRDELRKWDPQNDTNIEGDPFNTLFVAKLNFKTTEEKLKQEFSEYGEIKRIRLVKDQNGKARGYGFIEFEKNADMQAAFKYGDAKKIDDYRVLVDVERGRTVRNWKPRRLGGGLGNSRAPKPKMSELIAQQQAQQAQQQQSYHGGGGFRRDDHRKDDHRGGRGGFHGNRDRGGYRGGFGGGGRDRYEGGGGGYNSRGGGHHGGYQPRRDDDDRRGMKRQREF